VKTTLRERQALRHIHRKHGVDWTRWHANTINALQRKGLIERADLHAWKLTHAGLDTIGEIGVPNIFDDLFPAKPQAG
jgi:hypothetical protein